MKEIIEKMMEKMMENALLILIIFTLIVNWFILKNTCHDFENDRCIGNGISFTMKEKYDCEKIGGLYMGGSAFSTANCIK